MTQNTSAAVERPAGHLKLSTRAHDDDGPPARLVVRIEWDSGFRGTDLRVGDLLVGDDNGRWTPEAVQRGMRPGDHSESRWLDPLGLRAGDPIGLLVLRDGEDVRIEGRLVEHTNHRDAEGRRAFGADGPAHSEKDGFTYSWSSWWNKLRDLVETVLLGWDYTTSYDTHRLNEQLGGFTERVAFLGERYPGPFSSSVQADHVAALAMVAGEPRELTDADLEYRKLGAVRAARVNEASDAALDAFLAELGDSLLGEPFPAPEPFEEDHRPFIGKLVRLPALGKRDILHETKRSWFKAGRSQGVYLVDRHNPALRPVYGATDRYIEAVDPFLRDWKTTIIGEVEEQPALVSDPDRNITVVGLRLRPIAALVEDAGDGDGRLFIDLRGFDPEAPEVELPFAGEADLLSGVRRPRLEDGQSPEDVLLVAFECLKLGDFDTWLSCFADWNVRSWYDRSDAFLWVDRTWSTLSEREGAALWDRARRLLMEEVCGAEVGSLTPPKVVYDASEQPAGSSHYSPEPRIVEEVRARVNHIEQTADGFRTFSSGKLNRKWTLQRMDGGPWRLVTAKAL